MRVLIAVLIPLIAILGTYIFVNSSPSYSDAYFSKLGIPIERLDRLYDIGVADINQDGLLDIYTANHNFLNSVLINGGKGYFSDRELGEIGLNQVVEFGGLEPTSNPPIFDQPGIYIYWLGDYIHIRYWVDPSLENVHGTLHSLSRTYTQDKKTGKQLVDDPGDSTVEVETKEITTDYWQSTVQFRFTGNGHVVMRPALQDTPIRLGFPEHIPLSSIFVGRLAVTPTSHSFDISLQDRHGYAWADFNSDRRLDAYVSRGGSNGRIAKLPEDERRLISDELLIQNPNGGYKNKAVELGVTKNICSGRKVAAIDYNNDNKVDIYVNCLYRGISLNKVSKQLFRQDINGKFTDVADDVGLGLPDTQFQSQLWIDVDNDSDLDLVATSDSRILLIRNDGGHFKEHLIAKIPYEEVPLNSKLRIDNEWQFDRKLSAADFDADGDVDIFMSSPTGNALLINHNGELRLTETSVYKLPDSGLGASWVDYDNDGLVDLHIFPYGLYKQGIAGNFERAIRFKLAEANYYSAIANWFDLDNDGDSDVIMALDTKPHFFKDEEKWHERKWDVVTLSNKGSTNHWLQLELTGPPGNAQAYGSQVFVKSGGRTQYQQVGLHDGSYFSQGHYRIYFGLGSSKRVDSVLVKWLDGSTQEIRDLGVDQVIKLQHLLK